MAAFDAAMPRLYLVRHGEASAEGPDGARMLTARGAADVERLAQWAARVSLSVAEIRHSTRRRTAETATLFAKHLDPRRGVKEIEGIGPNDDAAPFVDDLISESEPVMIVSHLPFLEHALVLLTGSVRPAVVFRPATLVALDRADDRFVVDFAVHPGVV